MTAIDPPVDPDTAASDRAILAAIAAHETAYDAAEAEAAATIAHARYVGTIVGCAIVIACLIILCAQVAVVGTVNGLGGWMFPGMMFGGWLVWGERGDRR